MVTSVVDGNESAWHNRELLDQLGHSPLNAVERSGMAVNAMPLDDVVDRIGRSFTLPKPMLLREIENIRLPITRHCR